MLGMIDGRRCFTTGCSLTSHPGQIIIIIIIIFPQWLELLISATLSTLVVPKSKYGISLILPSTKFAQCQVVFRNAFKSSPNNDINLFGPVPALVAIYNMTSIAIPNKS